MVTTELGACEWFVWDLRRSNLIERGRLDQIVGEFLGKHPDAEPPGLAEFLVGTGVLTDFQAERLLKGKTQGFVLGPFTLKDALGTGSMGTVYKAQSKNDSNWYAVKVLPRRSMWNVRIARRKVRVFETCKHPAVVPFVDVGTAGGMHYLAWPLVEGETLENFVKSRGKLSLTDAATYASLAADGLSVCHEEGLFHGLLKASNLMVNKEGQIYILDFGIGCLLAETEGESLVDTMSTANSVASGLDCASPESIMDPSNLTPAGDQYSLGCILYYLLAGQYPFPTGTAVEKMMAHQFKQPTPVQEVNPEVPAELAAVVERLMQKAPADRYPSMNDVINDLRPWAKNRGSRPVLRPEAVADFRLDGLPKAKPPSPRDTPRPSSRGGPLSAPKGNGLPSRQSLFQNTPAAPTISTPAAPAELAPTPRKRSSRSLEEKIGPVGVVVLGIVACVVAWFVTWRFF